MIDRRTILTTSAAAALSMGGIRAFSQGYTPPPFGPTVVDVDDPRDVLLSLDAGERAMSLPAFAGLTLPLWTFSDQYAPLIRMRLGDRLITRLSNNLPRKGEHTSIHWHGLRLPNDQDGVPYICQPPVEPGENWTYAFTPPDAGTFFFHTHCNTVEQLGRGMAGVIIVDGDEATPFDADETLVLKDWRIGEDGGFLPFFTSAGAKKRGSFGTVRSCNGVTNPAIEVPAEGDLRLRVINIDSTRVMMLGIKGAEAFVIAVDGVACPPFPLSTWVLGPAMRFDLMIRSPRAGQQAQLLDYFAPQPIPVATFASRGPSRRATAFAPRALRKSRIPDPDLENARKMKFSFSAAASDEAMLAPDRNDFQRLLLDELCLSFETNWAINKTVWPGRDHSEVPPPIAMLELGRTYVFELNNLTSVHHPIHIHGHTFKVLKSNKRKRLPLHHSDTVLLAPKERLTVAFVADNPGDWMFHCHLIEHQETGMMSYLRVG